MSPIAIIGIIFLFLLLAIVFVAATILYMMMWNRAAQFLRRKGYEQAGMLVLLSWVIGALGLVCPMVINPDIGALQYVLYIFTLIGVLPAAFFVWADSLPQKSLSRTTGNRTTKVNWLAVGNWVTVLFVLGLILIFWRAETYRFENFKNLMLRLIMGFVLLVFLTSLVRGFSWSRFLEYDLFAQVKSIRNYFRILQYAYEKPDIEKVVSDDKRPPVLFIRSFLLEYAPFYVGNLYRNKVHTQISPDLLIMNMSDASFAGLNFQQFFEQITNEKIGRLIGLGNPEDRRPPEGLSVSYYPDKAWQEAFGNWAHRSSAVFNVPGGTAGLRFELEYILQNGLADKFFIFTPPPDSSVVSDFIRPLLNWMLLTTSMPWSKFASDMNAFGYQVQYKEPPAGAVIGFEKNGRQRILTSGAKNPMDYLEAVLASLPKKL